MRVVVQRCKEGSVKVDNKIVGTTSYGMVLLVGFTEGDNSNVIDYMVDKIINLRIFDDDNGVMNKSLIDINGSILSVSQFTLYGDARKGRRPNYIKALNGEKAIKLYDEFNNKIKKQNIKLETGIFGSEMEVKIVNDGPVTIILEKETEDEK